MIIKRHTHTLLHAHVCVNVDFGWPNPKWLIEAGRRCYRNYNCFENSPFPRRCAGLRQTGFLSWSCTHTSFWKIYVCVFITNTHSSGMVSMWEWCSFFLLLFFRIKSRWFVRIYWNLSVSRFVFFLPSYLSRGVWFTAFRRLNVPYFDCRSIDYVIYRIICSGNL